MSSRLDGGLDIPNPSIPFHSLHHSQSIIARRTLGHSLPSASNCTLEMSSTTQCSTTGGEVVATDHALLGARGGAHHRSPSRPLGGVRTPSSGGIVGGQHPPHATQQYHYASSSTLSTPPPPTPVPSCKRARGVCNMMGLFAMSFGYSFVSTTMFTLLIPREMERLHPHRTSLWLGILMGLSAICQMTSPLMGAWSDRIARRGVFLFVGTCISLVGIGLFLLLSFYESWGGTSALSLLLLFLGSVVVTLGLTTQYSIVTSLLSDCVLEDQMGKGSGVLAVLTFLGSGAGYSLFAMKTSPESLYMLFLSMSAFCYLVTWRHLPRTLDAHLSYCRYVRQTNAHGRYGITNSVGIGGNSSLIHTTLASKANSSNMEHVSMLRDTATVHGSGTYAQRLVYLREFLRHSYMIPDAAEHRDFLYACGARALFNVGLSAQVFLIYYYRDIMKESDPLHVLSCVCVAVLIGSVVAALPAGILSDSIGKKSLIYVSVSICITCVILFVTSQSINMHLCIAVLYGVGNVAFLSLDYALGVQTLPRHLNNPASNSSNGIHAQNVPSTDSEVSGLITGEQVVYSTRQKGYTDPIKSHPSNNTVAMYDLTVPSCHASHSAPVAEINAISEPKESGKDLGIFSMSSTVGQLIGQILYGTLLDYFRYEPEDTSPTSGESSSFITDPSLQTSHYVYQGFIIVYACCCCAFALAGVCVYRIRSVR